LKVQHTSIAAEGTGWKMTEDALRPSTSALPATELWRSGHASKVPAVTVYFWTIKVLCTTVGETASDFLNMQLGLGLNGTSVAAGIALIIALRFQFHAKRYVPPIYWLTVVLISVFGTLVTDLLTDSLHVPLEVSTILFSVALAVVFSVWYASERTLSIHSIFTVKREAFYWSAVLLTFALGTAAGDLMAEKLGLGYLVTGLIVVAVIVLAAIAWRLGLDAVLGFWIVYILTRPLGASLGDYLSQSRANGGLGLGATITSAGFLVAIVAVVLFLVVTGRDSITGPPQDAPSARTGRAVVWQLAVIATLGIIASGVGYAVRSAQLRQQAAASVSPAAPLGDLGAFEQIAADMLRLVHAGDTSGVRSRADDLETHWDNAQALLRPMNPAKWTQVDDAIDDVLRKARSGKQNARETVASLEALLHEMNTLGQQKPQPTAAEPSRPAPQAPTHAATAKPLGDLSVFRTIAADLLRLERADDKPHARSRAIDLETAWDHDESRLRSMSPAQWTTMDDAIDDVLRKTRAGTYAAAEGAASVERLIALIDRLDSQM
jgi:uncharacterized membrane-anchored protein